MSDSIYIYGIIKTSSPQTFGEFGVDNEMYLVQTTGFQNIAAVVSRRPFVVYDSVAKEKTVKDLLTHQVVIEKVMERFTILPVKFGTMLETEEETVECLEKGYVLLDEELRKMEGKVEVDVVAICDGSKILASLYRHNNQIQEKQKAIALKGDKVSLEDKVALGKLVEQELKVQKASYHQLILETLKEGTGDVCLHDLATDEMIFNAAFLLDKQQVESFHTAVTNLDQQLENIINFRVVGPLPLYSFSTILLERIDPRTFEEARKTFGLNGEITAKIVRDTYHRLSQQSHPDKSRAQDSQDFRRIHAAYKTLRNYTEKGPVHVGVYRWEKDLQ